MMAGSSVFRCAGYRLIRATVRFPRVFSLHTTTTGTRSLVCSRFVSGNRTRSNTGCRKIETFLSRISFDLGPRTRNSYSTSKHVNRGASSTCWNCRKALTEDSKFFCPSCSVILPPSEMTYYETLDLKENFDISPEYLQKQFKDLQKLFHPDKFTLKSDEEKRISEEVSSLINVAYFTLSDPLQRAVYLLKLKGITINEDTQLDDPEFLMEVMELNEKIAECEDDESLIKLQQQIQDQCTVLIKDISHSFNTDQIEDAKNYVIKLRYYNNMAEILKHMIPPS